MKRRLLLILLLLVGGAIVNVAVAWGRAVFPPQGRQRGDLTAWRPFTPEGSSTGWQLDRRARWGIVRIVAFPQAPPYTFARDHDIPAIYPPWSGWPRRLDESDGPNLPGQLMVEAAGWPALTLCDSWQYPQLGQTAPEERGWTNAIVLPRGRGVTNAVPRALPLQPIWRGFAINTLFYAFVLWLLFAAPFVLRRWRRIKRGLCLKCGYDLRNQAIDSSVCPECGAALRITR